MTMQHPPRHPANEPPVPAGWPWDQAPDALVSKLSAALAEQLLPGPVFVLVDPYLDDIEATTDTRPRHPIPGETLPVPSAQLPYLMELTQADDPLLAQSLRCAIDEHLQICITGSGACRIGGWLQPHQNGVGAGAALARQMGALLQAGGAPNGGHYLRLADRRVLGLLQRLGTPNELWQTPAIDWSVALQGLASWTFMDNHFALQSLHGRPGAPSQAALPLEANHWQWLTQAEALHCALALWQRQCHPLPADAYEQVAQALLRGRQRGLREAPDLAAYAVQALLEPAFEHWPSLEQLLRVVVRTGQELSDALKIYRSEWVGRPVDHWRTGNPNFNPRPA